MVERVAHTSIQVQRRYSDIPCAMALRLIRARPGETGLCCHRLRKDAFASCERTPTTGASGPHDFTVHSGAFVSCAAAATASHRNTRDDRVAPLNRMRWRY